MATSTRKSTYDGFTAEERAAMKERAKELKAAQGKADDETAVLEKIAELDDDDRAIVERIHAIVKSNAPELAAKLWYGQPAYAKAGKIVCFFQPAAKFNTRYATLGFTDSANLDDGPMWPTAFAITNLTPTTEKQLTTLIKKAVS